MGTHCSSELYRGHIFKSKITTMKLLLLTALAAVAMAEPEAEAGYYGYHPGFYGYYGHQLNWPAYSAPGFSSQCFGCRGKRSAEADAEPGYYGYPYGYHGYPYAYGFGYGHALPGHSYTHVSRVLERGQLRLMPNLDIMDILMELDITDTPIIMDTVLLDPELLDMLAVVPLLLPEALKV